MTSVNAKPVPMATSRMHSTNVTTMGFLNMLFKSDTSGMEQPRAAQDERDDDAR